MSLLEKIVFVADYMEPGRKQAPRLELIRRTAFTDLDGAFGAIMQYTRSQCVLDIRSVTGGQIGGRVSYAQGMFKTFIVLDFGNLFS